MKCCSATHILFSTKYQSITNQYNGIDNEIVSFPNNKPFLIVKTRSTNMAVLNYREIKKDITINNTMQPVLA